MKNILKEYFLKKELNYFLNMNINNMYDKNYYFPLKNIENYIDFIKKNEKLCKIIPIYKYIFLKKINNIYFFKVKKIISKKYIVFLKIDEKNKILYNFCENENDKSFEKGLWSNSIYNSEYYYKKNYYYINIKNDYT